MKKIGSLFLPIIAFIFLFTSSSKAQEVVNTETKRPKIGLVLSGGGAKGLAHIGVLKVLEELDIKPDYITGTSMGAVVGGLYAIGYTAHELDSLVAATDWYAAFSDQLSYDKIGLNAKNGYTNYLLNLSGNNFKEIRLPLAMVHGQIISELLSKLTWRSIGIDSFDDFPIPYRCLAADIISGNTIVFNSGSLAKAIRASMAIPTIFTPIVDDGMLLVDGGVINNFPVQECIDMGADIVIGVYVGTNENTSAKDLNTMVKIMGRSASFLGVVNAKKQLNNLDIKIIPDLQGASVESFNISEEIIKYGEEAARREDVYTKLVALSDELKAFPKKQIIDQNRTKQEIAIFKINVKGLNHVKKEFVIRVSQIEENTSVNSNLLNDALKRLYATMFFDKIEYRFVKSEQGYDLEFYVVEKDVINIRSSVYFDNFIGAGVNVNASYKHLLVNSSTLDLIMDISQFPRAKLNYSLFGGKRKRLFFSLGVNTQSIVIPNFYEFPNSLIVSMGQFRNNQLNLYSSLGLSTTKNSSLEFKASHTRNYFQLQGGLDDLYGIRNVSSTNLSLEALFKINTLNHPIFPTKGVSLDIVVKRLFKQTSSYTTTDGMFKPISNQNDVVVIDYKQYILVGNRFSIIPELTVGYMSSFPFYADKFFLGGNSFSSRINTFNQAGVLPFHIATDNFLRFGLGVQLKIIDNWYTNAYYQRALFINNSETFAEQSLEIDGESISAWAASVAYNSLIGPLKFTMTQNINSSEFYYYFSLGFAF